MPSAEQRVQAFTAEDFAECRMSVVIDAVVWGYRAVTCRFCLNARVVTAVHLHSFAAKTKNADQTELMDSWVGDMPLVLANLCNVLATSQDVECVPKQPYTKDAIRPNRFPVTLSDFVTLAIFCTYEMTPIHAAGLNPKLKAFPIQGKWYGKIVGTPRRPFFT